MMIVVVHSWNTGGEPDLISVHTLNMQLAICSYRHGLGNIEMTNATHGK